MRARLPMLLWVAVMIVLGCRVPAQDERSAAAVEPEPQAPADAAVSDPATSSGDRMTAPVAYRCTGLLFTAQFATDHVLLQTAERRYALLQAGTAEGAAIYDSGDVRLSTRGSNASLRLGDRRYDDCRERSAAESPPGP